MTYEGGKKRETKKEKGGMKIEREGGTKSEKQRDRVRERNREKEEEMERGRDIRGGGRN